MEYNKRQFQKSNDKKVLHKVRKHWVVLSTALLMMIGGKAVASHVSARADVNSNQHLSQLNTIKNQMNQNLVKGQAVPNSNQQGQSNSNHLNASQISQQAVALHNDILRHASVQSINNQNQNNNAQQTESVNGRQNHQVTLQNSNPTQSASVNAVNNNSKAINHVYQASNVAIHPRIAQKSSVNSNASNQNNVNQSDRKATRLLGNVAKRNLSGSNNGIVSGKWGSANYSLNLNTGLLMVKGGQINHFQYLKSANPNDSLVKNENLIKSIEFSDVQAPSDASSHDGDYNGNHQRISDGQYFDNIHNPAYNNLDKENGELFPNQENLINMDASGLDTSNTTNMVGMFGDMPHLTNLQLGGRFNVSKAVNMNSMFYDDESLKTLDLQHFNAINVSDMKGMFASDDKLSDLNLDHFKTSSDLKDTSTMFYSDGYLKHLDLKGFNTTHDQNMYEMFAMDRMLNGISFKDAPLFKTSDVTNMSGMFANVCEYADPFTLDVSNFNTKKVTTMNSMFEGADVNKIILGNNFYTSNVQDIGSMFANLRYINTIGFSPTDDIYLGNHFDLSHCFNYDNWSYTGPVSDTIKDLANPNNWYAENDQKGLFGSDSSLYKIDLSHLQPGVSATGMINDDPEISSINLHHFHLVGPEILSSDGSYYTNDGGYKIEHPGITMVPGIGLKQDNPYKNYDMMSTNKDLGSFVSINLNSDITFKQDPTIDPNQQGNPNCLDGTFYRLTPSDRLISANLADGKKHPGSWFRNVDANVIIYQDHGHIISYNSTPAYSDEDEPTFYDQVVSTPAPAGYKIPDAKNDIVLSPNNQNNPGSTSNFIGIVNVTGDSTTGTTMIPAKFYSDKGNFVKSGMVPIHYSGNIGTQFVATANNVSDIPDKNDNGGYDVMKLIPTNNVANIIPDPDKDSSNVNNYPSVLNWDSNNEPGLEPTVIFRHQDQFAPRKHTEVVPYVFTNEQGQIESNVGYITKNVSGGTAHYGDTVNLPTTLPSNLSNGYVFDTSRNPRTITINGSNMSNPANGQTKLIKIYVIGKPVSYTVPVTVNVYQKGESQPKTAVAHVTLSGRVGNIATLNSNDITDANLKYGNYNHQIIPSNHTTLITHDSYSALLKPANISNGYEWYKAGTWDNSNNRPEINYVYDPANIEVHLIDETNPNHHFNNGDNLSIYDNLSDEINHEPLPSGYYIDPDHQNYDVHSQNGKKYININLLNDDIWTGYYWGNAQVAIDTANDTIYVYGGKSVNTPYVYELRSSDNSDKGYTKFSDAQNRTPSIFNDLIKETKNTNPNDPNNDKNSNVLSDWMNRGHNNIDFRLERLPNDKHDWKIDIQNASVSPNGFTHGLFKGNNSISNQFSSIDVSHLNTSKVSDLSSMFADDSNLQHVSVNGLNTSNVSYMNSMFYNDPKLDNVLLNKLDTKHVISMGSMFDKDYALKHVNLNGSFDTSKVSDMFDMFHNDSSLSDLNLMNFNTNHVTNMNGMFDNDNALNKIALNSKTHLNSTVFNAKFFKHNVNPSGNITTSLIDTKGNQPSDVYYAAYPIAIKLINKNNGDIFNTSDHIDVPYRLDSQYHGQINDQMSHVSVRLPSGYHKLSQQNYTVHNPNHNPYIVISIAGNKETVPVVIMDTTPGFNSHSIKRFSVTGITGDTVKISTTLPSGYQWGNATKAPANPYSLRIVNGNDEGQAFDNSGITKPVVFDAVTSALKLPVKFVDRTSGHNNQVVKYESDPASLDQATLLDTTLPIGYHWVGKAPVNPDNWLVQYGEGAGNLNHNGLVNPLIFNVAADNETIPVEFIDDTPGHNDTVVKQYSDSNALGNTITLDTSLPTGYQWDQTPPSSKTWKITRGNGMGQVNDYGQVNPIIYHVKSQSSQVLVKFVDDNRDGQVIKHYTENGNMGSTVSLDTALPAGYRWNQVQPNNPDVLAISSGNGAGQMTSSGKINPIVFHVTDGSETVPVYFKDGNNIVKQTLIPSQMNDTVSVNTSLPTGYQWNQKSPAKSYNIKITDGSQPGQVDNDSGYTNPIVFQVKTGSYKIPVEFIDQTSGHNNKLVKESDVSGSTGSVVSIDTSLPQGYYWNQSVPANPELLTISSGDGAGQINANGTANPIIFDVKANSETVPVEFMDNNGNVINSYNVVGQTGNSVEINTTLPTGYHWDQASIPSNPFNWTINSGNGAGQVADNSGYTKPLIFHIKGNSNTIPVSFIDQNGNNEGYSSVNGSIGERVAWPTSAPYGFTINQGQAQFSTLTPSDIKGHVIHVTGDPVNVRVLVTIIKMGAKGEQSSDVVKVPLEGHVGDSYTFSNSDFVNIPSDYTLDSKGQSYSARLIGDQPNFRWVPTNNRWDNKNNRPEIILNANEARPVTIHYINQNNDEIGETQINGKVSDSVNIDNPDADKNSYFAQNLNTIPSDYSYDSSRTRVSQITFSQNPQNVNVYVVGKPASVSADYQYQGQDMGAAGSVNGHVGDPVILSTNNVPMGFSIDPDDNLNSLVADNGTNYNHLKLVNNKQAIHLISHQMTVPVKFEDANHDNQMIGNVNYATKGKIGDTVTLPSAPDGYQYQSGQSNQYQLQAIQIHSDHEMNPIIVKLTDKPAQVRVHYIDQLGHDLTNYVASGVIGSSINLHGAPNGYVYNNYDDDTYQFKPSNIQHEQNESNGKLNMNDDIIHVHSSYFDNVTKHVLIEYENNDGSIQPSDTYNKAISFSGRIGDVYFFDPNNLNVPKGYQLLTTDNDRAVINNDGTATWLTDAQHHDPVLIFKAEPSIAVPHVVRITQVKELPSGKIIGTDQVSDAISDKSVGQSYQISDDPNNQGLIKSPVHYHLAQNDEQNAQENQNVKGDVTADGLTKNHATWYYVANDAPDIMVHYRIHGHNSDVGVHDYKGVYGQQVNSIDAIPSGYSLNTKYSKVNTGTIFTFGKTTQQIVYVNTYAPTDKRIPVKIILEAPNGQPINDPDVQTFSDGHGKRVTGFQASVPVIANSDESFRITPSDSALAQYTKGFTPYNNSDISGIQKAEGPDITSHNQGTFVYRANSKAAGTITVQYRNQNGDLIKNPVNHATSYQIPGGYPGRYVSDVTKLTGLPLGYLLLGNSQRDCTFNGTNQNVLVMLQGAASNRFLTVKIVKEDPNGKNPVESSDSDSIAYATVGDTYTLMPSDYLPHNYSMDTNDNRDQPVKFTVRSDGSFTNNGTATFYYTSNSSNDVNKLRDVTVNYENIDNGVIHQETIDPHQVSDAYDGRVISNVTKYAPVPTEYKLVKSQDLQATLSDTESPAVTVKVDPTSSVGHNSDNTDNAQPITITFKYNSQTIGQPNRRLDGYMDQTIDPFDQYSVPTGYNLAQTKPLPKYTISNHPQHFDVQVTPKADSIRDYWLTIHIVTPSDRPLKGIDNSIKVPLEVPINSSMKIDPNHIDLNDVDLSQVAPGSNLNSILNSKYYAFDSTNSSNSFKSPLTVYNHSENLSATDGQLVYKSVVNPQASLGTIIVKYYDNDSKAPMYGAGGVITQGYLGKRFTASQLADDSADNVQIPQGYSLNDGQNEIYTLNANGSQEADLRVHGNEDDPTSSNYTATIRLIKEGADHKAQGNPIVIKLPIAGNIGSDYVINASDYTPYGYTVDPTKTSQIQGTILNNHLSVQAPVFYYVSSTNAKPIYVRYINQSGQQVGYTDTISGNYGNTINVSDANSYGENLNNHGENVPDGYTLQSGQNTNYQFNSDVQNVNLYVMGDSDVTNHYLVHIIKKRGDDQTESDNIMKTITGRVGDQIEVDPTDYVPSDNYGVDPSDQVQKLTITPNISNDTQPNQVSFTYSENPVVARLVYKDSTDCASVSDAQVGERTLYGPEGSLINYNNYTEFLPKGYVLDHVSDPNARLERGQSYIVYIKQNYGKPATPVNQSDAYIKVEYKDTTNQHIFNTQTIEGHDGYGFIPNIYMNRVPAGYQNGTIDPASQVPASFIADQPQTLVVDVTRDGQPLPKSLTDQVDYVDFNSGKTVTRQSITGASGDRIDWSKYTDYMPNGYYYYKLGAHEDTITGNSNVVYLLPTVPEYQYSTVTVNYVDVSDNKTIANNETYGIVGDPFDVSSYEDDITNGAGTGANQSAVSYHYDHVANTVDHYGKNPQTINVYVKRTLPPASPFSSITVEYVDADHGDRQVGSPITISGYKGDIFDPSSFENNLPEGYSFTAIKGNPVYNFGEHDQTMIIRISQDD